MRSGVIAAQQHHTLNPSQGIVGHRAELLHPHLASLALAFLSLSVDYSAPESTKPAQGGFVNMGGKRLR